MVLRLLTVYHGALRYSVDPVPVQMHAKREAVQPSGLPIWQSGL